MNVQLVEEFLSFLEVRRMKLEQYRKKVEGRSQIDVDDYLDVLIEADHIIIKALQTIKNLNHDKVLVPQKKDYKSERVFQQLITEYNITETKDEFRIPTKNENYPVQSKNILTLDELISTPKEDISKKFDIEQSSDLVNPTYKKRMFIWSILKRLHLNEQYRSFFGRKYGQGSFEIFKRKVLSNSFSERTFEQILVDTESFITINKLNIDFNL